MSEDRAARRVLVIGLDGADLDLLRPWLEDGSLPCLSRLHREGAHGRLSSTIPPLSPEAWASFSTGSNPGKHGVVNFVQPRPGSYELLLSCGATRRGKTLWQLAGEAGARVGVINVPMTYPPEPVNGFLVSGPDTPGVQAQFTYPPELKNELLADPRRYEIHGDYWGRTTPADYLRRLIETVQNHTRAWLYLLGKYQPDLFVGVFGSTDRAQHFLWKYSDPDHPAHEALEATSTAHPIRAVYQAVDAAISELLAAVGDDVTVIVMSDHGAGPCSKVVYLDRWLESQGLLTYRNDRGHSRRSLMQSAYLLARKHFPRWAKDWLKTRWHGVREGIESSILRDPIDWGRTQAFFLGTESAYIYLNLQGRFPEGVVRPGAEAESVSRRIVEGLSALQDLETGLPVVAAVHRKEEIYRGPRELVSLLPDLVVTWRDWSYVVRRARGEGAATPGAIVESGVRTGDAARFMSLELSGCHRPEGILLARGPGVPAGREVSGAHIMDLAPTMLSLLGVPIPAHMDGKVLPEVTGAGSPGRQSADAQADANLTDRHEAVSYSEEEREEMKRRLRALGYLE